MIFDFMLVATLVFSRYLLYLSLAVRGEDDSAGSSPRVIIASCAMKSAGLGGAFSTARSAASAVQAVSRLGLYVDILNDALNYRAPARLQHG